MADEDQDQTYTAKQLARKLGTDPKTLRKFLRSGNSPVEAVGQGGRYEFDAEAAELIGKAFKGWNQLKPTPLKSEKAEAVEEVFDEDIFDEEVEEEPEPAPKPKRSRAKKKEPEPEPEPLEEELEEIDAEDLDDLFEELDDE